MHSPAPSQEIEGMMAIVAKGDAMKQEDLQKVMNGELSSFLHWYLITNIRAASGLHVAYRLA